MEKLLPWFYLKSIPGVGNLLFKRLITHFKTPERVLGASLEELSQIEGVTARLAANIRDHQVSAEIKRELNRVNQNGIQVVTYANPAYPPLLREIPDPPPYLYVCGNLEGLEGNIAVVGSRNATPYGIKTAVRLCRDLVQSGATVVSGMAIGIDTAAHEGALSAGGKTVAVLGSGLGRIYPVENLNLFHRISEKGAVITEFPYLAEPEAHHFPMRNRIISGMSLGTVVVEASRKSGSLITARLAAEQNREVFAVPGSIQSFKSVGTHTLIKQGAKLVEHAKDIIEELPPMFEIAGAEGLDTEIKTNKTISALSPEERKVYKALGPYPIHIDDIVRTTCIEAGKLSGILLKLEIKGIVQQSPGKIFSVPDR